MFGKDFNVTGDWKADWFGAMDLCMFISMCNRRKWNTKKTIPVVMHNLKNFLFRQIYKRWEHIFYFSWIASLTRSRHHYRIEFGLNSDCTFTSVSFQIISLAPPRDETWGTSRERRVKNNTIILGDIILVSRLHIAHMHCACTLLEL